eukprot:Skav235243  [mRNA]  locus=scaffold3995:301932:304511:+ [translate_table: standard]
MAVSQIKFRCRRWMNAIGIMTCSAWTRVEYQLAAQVAVVRIAPTAAFDLNRLQPFVGRQGEGTSVGLLSEENPEVLDLEVEPVFGEALSFIGYCRQELTSFKGRCRGVASGEQLRIEVSGKLPEKGASGGPVVASGRAVAVHLGLFREASGASFRGTLRPKLPLPSQVQITGRRGTNDILNGIYTLVDVDSLRS